MHITQYLLILRSRYVFTSLKMLLQYVLRSVRLLTLTDLIELFPLMILFCHDQCISQTPYRRHLLVDDVCLDTCSRTHVGCLLRVFARTR